MAFLVYIMICAILPNLIWQVNCKNRTSLSHAVWTFVFMIYIALALYVAEIGSFWDMISYKKLMGSINTEPFAPGGFKPDMLNIIMFMPLGFLLPLNWSSFRSLRKVALTGLGFSALIEFFQLFNYRITDVDDLIMNTIGACVGYFIWTVFRRFVKNKRTIERIKAEPVKLIMIGILGVCFFYNWRFVDAMSL